MARKIAGIDLGNDTTKVQLGPNEHFKIRNAVKWVQPDEYRNNLGLDSKEPEILDDLDVFITGKGIEGRYFVGPLAIRNKEERVNPGTPKLQNNFIAIPMLTLLALSAREGQKEVDFGIGCGLPIAEFKADKVAFAERLSGRYSVRFMSGVLKDREVIINIENPQVLPEGVAVIMNQTLNEQATGYKNKRLMEIVLGVCDIGAFTTDFAVIARGTPDSDASRGLKKGVAECIDRVVENVNRQHGINMTRAQLMDRVEKGDLVVPIRGERVNLKPSVDQEFTKLAREIIAVLQEIWQDNYEIETFFIVGGGAKALAPALKEEAAIKKLSLTFLEDEDPQLQNVSGYWKYAKMKHGGKK